MYQEEEVVDGTWMRKNRVKEEEGECRMKTHRGVRWGRGCDDAGAVDVLDPVSQSGMAHGQRGRVAGKKMRPFPKRVAREEDLRRCYYLNYQEYSRRAVVVDLNDLHFR